MLHPPDLSLLEHEGRIGELPSSLRGIVSAEVLLEYGFLLAFDLCLRLTLALLKVCVYGRSEGGDRLVDAVDDVVTDVVWPEAEQLAWRDVPQLGLLVETPEQRLVPYETSRGP